MKKLNILPIIALALGFAACDDVELGTGIPVENPQLATVTSADITITEPSSTPITVNLITLAENNESAVIGNASLSENWPSDYTLTPVFEVAADAEFTKATELTGTNTDGALGINATSLNEFIYENVSKAPVAQSVYVRYTLTATKGNQSIKIGDTVYGPYEVVATPFEPEEVIEEEYYLVGSFCDWDLAQAVKFTHNGESNVYDEPEFIVNFEVSADQASAGYSIKVVPASAFAEGSLDASYALVASEDNVLEGSLEVVAGTEGAYTIDQDAKYMLTINMMNKTFSLGYAYDYLYVPSLGTSFTDFSKVMKLATDDFITYKGVVRINHQFAFTCQESFTSGIVYIPSGDVTTSSDNVSTGEMALDSENSGARFSVPGNGLYYLEANIIKLTWKAALIEDISVVGQFNGWDTTTSVDLAHSKDYKTWTGEVTLTSGPYKFCCNHAWTYSFGGSEDNIVQNGGNLNCEEDGTYSITLSFAQVPYTVTVVKK